MCPHLCSFQIYARNVVEDYLLLLPDTFCGNVNNPIATASHFLNFLCSLWQIEFYEFPGGQSHIFIAQIELQPRPELEYGSHVDIRVVETLLNLFLSTFGLTAQSPLSCNDCVPVGTHRPSDALEYIRKGFSLFLCGYSP